MSVIFQIFLCTSLTDELTNGVKNYVALWQVYVTEKCKKN